MKKEIEAKISVLTGPASDLLRAHGRVFISRILSFFGPALGTIFLIPRPWVGLLLWSVFILNPRHGLFALTGLLIGVGAERLLKKNGAPTKPGGDIKTNALLAALAVSWSTCALPLLPLSTGLTIAIVAACGTSVLTLALERALTGTPLPAMVWAYCIVATMIFILFPHWTVLTANLMEPWPLPTGIIGFSESFLRSLGSILFIPDFRAGLIIGIAILLWSRSMFIAGLIGWIGGVLAALALQKLGLPYHWPPLSYNFFIAGMALGSGLFLPDRAGLPRAFLAGIFASFFSIFLLYVLHGSSPTYLPVPAALTIWIGIYALSRPDGKSVRQRDEEMNTPPEQNWWNFAHWTRRFGHDEPLLMIPIAGAVQISQGFGGTLSHAGAWCHALDFQRPGTPAGTEEPLWGTPVLAPGPGLVERVVTHVPDNPLGVCNYAENWGNHVIIHLDQGEWAMLAHLQQGTIAVIPGSRVEAGSYIAQVGNSGRSPFPHLHLQAQGAAEAGTPTTPFRLANYLSTDQVGNPLYHWNSSGIPVEGAVIAAAVANPEVHGVLASMAPGSAVWSLETEGNVPPAFCPPPEARTLRVNITLDEAGRHIFHTDGGGALVSTLAPDAWRLIETRDVTSPFLRLLGLAIPSIPYATTKGLHWDDTALLMPAGPAGWLTSWLAPYFPDRAFFPVACTCTAVPDSAGGNFLEIETKPAGRLSAPLPLSLTCRLQSLKGPVQIEAIFAEGRLVYSLVSFEPRLPFEDRGSLFWS